MVTRTGLWAALALAASVSLAAPAQAATTLVSPLVHTNYYEDSFGCTVLNAGNKAIAVTVMIISGYGTLITEAELVVPAGQARGLASFDIAVSEGAYCRFTGNFNKNQVRAGVLIAGDSRTRLFAPAE